MPGGVQADRTDDLGQEGAESEDDPAGTGSMTGSAYCDGLHIMMSISV